MQNEQWNYDNSQMTISSESLSSPRLSQDGAGVANYSTPGYDVKSNSLADEEIDQALNDVAMAVEGVERSEEDVGQSREAADGEKDENSSSNNELVLLPGGNIANKIYLHPKMPSAIKL